MRAPASTTNSLKTVKEDVRGEQKNAFEPVRIAQSPTLEARAVPQSINSFQPTKTSCPHTVSSLKSAANSYQPTPLRGRDVRLHSLAPQSKLPMTARTWQEDLPLDPLKSGRQVARQSSAELKLTAYLSASELKTPLLEEAGKSSASQRARVAMSTEVPVAVITDRSHGPPCSARTHVPFPENADDTPSPPTRAPTPRVGQLRDPIPPKARAIELAVVALQPQETEQPESARTEYFPETTRKLERELQAALEELQHTKRLFASALREKSEADEREADAVREKLLLQEKLEQFEASKDARSIRDKARIDRDLAQRALDSAQSQRRRLKEETSRYEEEVRDRYPIEQEEVQDPCAIEPYLACEVDGEVSGPRGECQSAFSRWQASPDPVARAEKIFGAEKEFWAPPRGSVCSTRANTTCTPRASTASSEMCEEQLSDEERPPPPRRAPSRRKSRTS